MKYVCGAYVIISGNFVLLWEITIFQAIHPKRALFHVTYNSPRIPNSELNQVFLRWIGLHIIIFLQETYLCIGGEIHGFLQFFPSTNP